MRCGIAKPAREVKRLSETEFGKSQPSRIVQVLCQRDRLLSGGNCLVRRSIEIQRRRPACDGSTPSPLIADLLRARFGVTAKAEPPFAIANRSEHEPRFDEQVDSALFTRYRGRLFV